MIVFGDWNGWMGAFLVEEENENDRKVIFCQERGVCNIFFDHKSIREVA